MRPSRIIRWICRSLTWQMSAACATVRRRSPASKPTGRSRSPGPVVPSNRDLALRPFLRSTPGDRRLRGATMIGTQPASLVQTSRMWKIRKKHFQRTDRREHSGEVQVLLVAQFDPGTKVPDTQGRQPQQLLERTIVIQPSVEFGSHQLTGACLAPALDRGGRYQRISAIGGLLVPLLFGRFATQASASGAVAPLRIGNSEAAAARPRNCAHLGA
jgi:hypothetical protein